MFKYITRISYHYDIRTLISVVDLHTIVISCLSD